MRILFLLHSYYKFNQGGAELQINYIGNYLAKQGFEVHYLFLHHEVIIDQYDAPFHLHTIKKSPWGERIFGKAFYYQRLLKRIQEIQPDLIYHRNLSNIMLPALHYANSNHTKTLIHLALQRDVERDLQYNHLLLRNLLDLLGKSHALKKSNFIIAQAHYQNDLLQKNFQRSANLTLPNIHPTPLEPLNKKGKTKILWVANFKSTKQPQKFIELARAFDQSVEFIMIGRQAKKEEAKRWEHAIQETPNLTYLGELPIDKVNSIFAQVDIFVNTSLYEGFPNTFIQAWMRKVPVISLHVNPDNLLTQEQIGLHAKNDQQLISDTALLIKNPQLRQSMGERAHKFALNEYALKNVEKIIQLIQE